MLWTALAMCAACGSTEAPRLMVQDSAGVRIVVNRDPAWKAGEAWTVSGAPLLSVGSVAGDPDLAFDRLSGAYLAGPDRLVVLDDGADEVGIFDLQGERLASFGGPGEGPGEFRSLELLGLRGDSLWLLDIAQPRITVVTSEGALQRVIRLPMENVRLGGAGLLPDGSSIVVSDLAFSSAIAEELDPGLQRFRAAYVRIGPAGEHHDTILVALGSERILQYGNQAVQMIQPLFARSVGHAVRGDRLVQSSQGSYEIGLYSPDGELESLIRRDGVDLDIDEQAYGFAVEARIADAPEPARPGLRVLYRDMPRPETRPALSDVLVDSEGFLWVEEFSYDGGGGRWAVFDQDGLWLGIVEFPDRFRPSQILADRVVGIWTDELDVEHVRVYELVRG